MSISLNWLVQAQKKQEEALNNMMNLNRELLKIKGYASDPQYDPFRHRVFLINLGCYKEILQQFKTKFDDGGQ